MKPFIRVMKALSDPSRVRIIKLLEQQELCVCELQELLGLAQSTVSKHLKILEESNLVEYRKEGLWIIYSLLKETSCPYSTTLLQNINQWLNDDSSIITMVASLPKLDKRNLCKTSF